MIPQQTSRHRYSSPEMKISKFAGVDYSTDPTQIQDNRSPKMVNMQLDAKGILQRFPGYKRAYKNALVGGTKVNMLKFNPIANKFIEAYGTKLYKFDYGDDDPVELYSGIANSKMSDFFYDLYQYFLDGANYLRFDGTNVIAVESVSYIPTTVIGRGPTGGGTVYEPVNLLQPGRRNSFIGNGTATVFQLDSVSLDATVCVAIVGGVAKAETTDFTVNRTTGQVTFLSAPADGAGVDNVLITFYKTITGYANMIKNCTVYAIFGSGNNLRVFLTGNANYKNRDWMSGLANPAYFPDTGYTDVGSSAVAIKKYANQQGTLQIIKDDNVTEPTIWLRSFLLADGVATFPVAPSNSSVGCVASESVQIIEDTAVFLSRKGVYRIATTYVSGERDLQHISDNVDAELLEETNLQNAISFDYSTGRYGIGINGKVYVFDYRNRYADTDGVIKYECYTWDSIPAACFLEKDGYLYFGRNDSGVVERINKMDDLEVYWNNAASYLSEWDSKIFALSKENYKKFIENITFTLDPLSVRSSADLYYKTDRKTSNLVKTIRKVKFSFDNINFNDFSFITSSLPQTGVKDINQSDVVYLQIILKNDRGGEGMTITCVTTKFSLAGGI